MLENLKVKNFAIIEELEINLTSGLNVMTGETGAGKSIIIGALDMLLGGRASRDVIRGDAERAYIEAVFEPKKLDLINERLEEAGIEPEEEMVLLTREIRETGRNRSRINGQLATLSMVNSISEYLVDIHGQHEHQSLLKTSLHLELLDAYIGREATELKEELAEIYGKIREIEENLSDFNIDEAERARQLDLLEFQIKEIEEADLQEGEIEELRNQYSRLSHTEDIFTVCGSIFQGLDGEQYENSGILDRLGGFMKQLEDIREYDKQLDKLYQQMQDVFYQLQDLSFSLRDYYEGLEYNEAEVEKIGERLDHIHRLQEKYGKTVADILNYKQKMAEQRKKLLSRDERKEELQAEKRSLEAKYDKLAAELSDLRRKQAKEFSRRIKKELTDLALADAVFSVDFSRCSRSPGGIDRVEFMISPNPGEELKPLAKIASGGELSRIMLAIKTITADVDRVETLIFDEVDSGVGGKTAQKMAEKLASIGQGKQILCITHLPQIASMADSHYYINKISEGERTYTDIYRLDRDGIKEELARMLGGVELTDTTLEHAGEMLRLARERKEKISRQR
ncbi:MAG: DNA repair protein RecN [Halanaerobiaceae bacterium]